MVGTEGRSSEPDLEMHSRPAKNGATDNDTGTRSGTSQAHPRGDSGSSNLHSLITAGIDELIFQVHSSKDTVLNLATIQRIFLFDL